MIILQEPVRALLVIARPEYLLPVNGVAVIEDDVGQSRVDPLLCRVVAVCLKPFDEIRWCAGKNTFDIATSDQGCEFHELGGQPLADQDVLVAGPTSVKRASGAWVFHVEDSVHWAVDWEA